MNQDWALKSYIFDNREDDPAQCGGSADAPDAHATSICLQSHLLQADD